MPRDVVRLIDLRELRRLVRVGHRADDRGREADDPVEILVVDLVGGVRRLVIVGVRARREGQAHDLCLVEAGDVGRLIRIGLDDQVEAGGDVGALEQARPHRARAGGLHDQLVVLHAADHVEVQIRGELIDRHRRHRDECRGADQADLLGGPQRDQHVAAARLFRERLGDREDRGRARRVVVGAEVDACRRPPSTRASCRGRRGRGDRSARRARPTACRRSRPASLPAGRRRRCGPCCRSRTIAVLSVTVTPGSANPATCGLPLSSSCWTSPSDAGLRPAKSASATAPLMLAAGMPEPARAVSNDIGIVWPAFGERGPVTTSSARAPR